MPISEFEVGESGYTTEVDRAAVEATSTAIDATLVAIDERSNVVSALPIEFRRRLVVDDTNTLIGTDASGAVKLTATLTWQPPKLTLNLRYVGPNAALPRDLLPAFRFLRALRRPNRFQLVVADRPMGEPSEIPSRVEFPQDLVELVRSAAFVQALTGTTFPLPEALEAEDLWALREAENLLRGESVESQWTDAELGMTVIDTTLLDVIEGGGMFRLEFIAPAVANIAGHDVQLGEARYVFRAAVAENYDELVRRRANGDESGATARLRPGRDDTYEVSLVAPPDAGIEREMRRPLVVSDDSLHASRERPLQAGQLRDTAP